MVGDGGLLAPNGADRKGPDFEPPEKHRAADSAGKILGNMADTISNALHASDEPVVLDRKGRHVSIKDLERLIDEALEE